MTRKKKGLLYKIKHGLIDHDDSLVTFTQERIQKFKHMRCDGEIIFWIWKWFDHLKILNVIHS